jgi:hypothetical protein
MTRWCVSSSNCSLQQAIILLQMMLGFAACHIQFIYLRWRFVACIPSSVVLIGIPLQLLNALDASSGISNRSRPDNYQESVTEPLSVEADDNLASSSDLPTSDSDEVSEHILGALYKVRFAFSFVSMPFINIMYTVICSFERLFVVSGQVPSAKSSGSILSKFLSGILRMQQKRH